MLLASYLLLPIIKIQVIVPNSVVLSLLGTDAQLNEVYGCFLNEMDKEGGYVVGN